MSAPTRADVDQLLCRARENLDMADAAADDAERHGRLRQAAQALSSAGRIAEGLSPRRSRRHPPGASPRPAAAPLRPAAS